MVGVVRTEEWTWQPGSTVRLYTSTGDKRDDITAERCHVEDVVASATGGMELTLPPAFAGSAFGVAQVLLAEGTGLDGLPRQRHVPVKKVA
jgi:hypothetical protein